MDWDTLRFAWDAITLILGNLVALGMIAALLALSATFLLYIARERVAHLRRWRERRMWREIGDILETNGFNDEETGGYPVVV